MGADERAVSQSKALFMKAWECRDMGKTEEFLGMRILRSKETIALEQRDYLKKVLGRFNMTMPKAYQLHCPLAICHWPVLDLLMSNCAPGTSKSLDRSYT